MEKILQLAQKLKALSDQGVGGEKENATRMLIALCEKHGIPLSDITDQEPIKTFEVWVEKDPSLEWTFFVQTAASVLGNDFKCGRYLHNYRKGQKYAGLRRCYIECTSSEFIEIQAKHKFFYKHFMDEVKVLYKAFVQTNKLYTKPDPNRKSEERELTPEEMEELHKMMHMMQGLDRKIFHKQLNQ